MLRKILLAGAAFAAMEPVAYAAHRWVMHGPGWGLHRSHHRRPPGAAEIGTGRPWRDRVEANDAFPVAFAATTIVAMAAGTRIRRLTPLVPVAIGVTAYGAVYSAVHDVYIHGRLGRRPGGPRRATLAQAHSVHHRGRGEPYGMLVPLKWRDRERTLTNKNDVTAGGVGNA